MTLTPDMGQGHWPPKDAAPYDDPMPPFRVDDEGDIVDANGWLIACPARGIWKNRQTLAETLCAVLNGDQ